MKNGSFFAHAHAAARSFAAGLTFVVVTAFSASAAETSDDAPSSVAAPVRILSSRVVFNEQDHAASLSIENNSDAPLLVSASVSPFAGVGLVSETTEDFMVSPGIKLVRPGEIRPFRIIRLREDLPKDEESLYIVNLRLLPGEASQNTSSQQSETQQEKARINVSFLGSVKLFWRPDAIANAFGSEEARSRMQARCEGDAITLVNPSPYWCTVSSLKTPSSRAKAPHEHIRTELFPMIEPHGTLTMPLDHSERCPKTLDFSLIGENGRVTAPRTLDVEKGMP